MTTIVKIINTNTPGADDVLSEIIAVVGDQQKIETVRAIPAGEEIDIVISGHTAINISKRWRDATPAQAPKAGAGSAVGEGDGAANA